MILNPSLRFSFFVHGFQSDPIVCLREAEWGTGFVWKGRGTEGERERERKRFKFETKISWICKSAISAQADG